MGEYDKYVKDKNCGVYKVTFKMKGAERKTESGAWSGRRQWRSEGCGPQQAALAGYGKRAKMEITCQAVAERPVCRVCYFCSEV